MTDRSGEVRATFADLDLIDPVAAFAYGVAYGRAIEREHVEADDEHVHRAGVRSVLVDITRADRRAHADRPGPREGDHAGGRVPVWGEAPVYTGAYSR